MTNNPFSKFLGPGRIEESIEEIAALAANAKRSVALVGGIAMQHYGSARLTKGIDIIADECPECFLRSINTKALTFGGQQTRLRSGAELNVIIHTGDFEGLHIHALHNAQKIKGLPIRVVLPEHLFAMKMAANRPKDEADMLFLATSGAIKVKATRGTIKTFLGPYAADVFDAFLVEAAWRKQTGRL